MAATSTASQRSQSPVDDEPDFAAWMAARQPAMLRTAYALTGDAHAAEDLVQNALAKIYLAWGRLADRGNLDGYARTVLVNEHRSAWRRPWRRRELTTAEPPDQPAPDTPYDGERAAVWALVATLPPQRRAVIVLRYYEGLSEAETAALLGISTGTVKSQSSRALAALRTHLADHPALGAREEER